MKLLEEFAAILSVYSSVSAWRWFSLIAMEEAQGRLINGIFRWARA